MVIIFHTLHKKKCEACSPKKKEKYKLSTRDIKWLRENNNRKNNVWIKISAVFVDTYSVNVNQQKSTEK